MRKPFHITDSASFKRQVEDALKTASKSLEKITANMIVPPRALEIPRQITIDLDLPPNSDTSLPNRKLKRNPLYTITDLSKVPQSEKKGFLVNGLFGNADHESITQIHLTSKSKATQKIL